MKIEDVNLTELIKIVKENNVEITLIIKSNGEITLIIKSNGEQGVSIKLHDLTCNTISTPCTPL